MLRYWACTTRQHFRFSFPSPSQIVFCVTRFKSDRVSRWLFAASWFSVWIVKKIYNISKNMHRKVKFRPPSRLLTSRQGEMRGAGLTRPHAPRPLAGRVDGYIVLRSLAATVRDGLICRSTSAAHKTKLQTAHLILNRLFIGHMLLLYYALCINLCVGVSSGRVVIPNWWRNYVYVIHNYPQTSCTSCGKILLFIVLCYCPLDIICIWILRMFYFFSFLFCVRISFFTTCI